VVEHTLGKGEVTSSILVTGFSNRVLSKFLGMKSGDIIWNHEPKATRSQDNTIFLKMNLDGLDQ
jgi:hypothetical protein